MDKGADARAHSQRSGTEQLQVLSWWLRHMSTLQGAGMCVLYERRLVTSFFIQVKRVSQISTRLVTPPPSHLGPVAEAVGVLALPVTQVECHDAALVVDAQGSKGAAPHVYCILKGEVGVGRLGGVTCGGGGQGAGCTRRQKGLNLLSSSLVLNPSNSPQPMTTQTPTLSASPQPLAVAPPPT
jgi:hypothetical protein